MTQFENLPPFAAIARRLHRSPVATALPLQSETAAAFHNPTANIPTSDSPSHVRREADVVRAAVAELQGATQPADTVALPSVREQASEITVQLAEWLRTHGPCRERAWWAGRQVAPFCRDSKARRLAECVLWLESAASALPHLMSAVGSAEFRSNDVSFLFSEIITHYQRRADRSPREITRAERWLANHHSWRNVATMALTTMRLLRRELPDSYITGLGPRTERLLRLYGLGFLPSGDPRQPRSPYGVAFTLWGSQDYIDSQADLQDRLQITEAAQTPPRRRGRVVSTERLPDYGSGSTRDRTGDRPDHPG